MSVRRKSDAEREAARNNDRAQFFEALRRSSARLLKLDPDALSAAQSVRVDRCAALRMLLDRFQSQQLSGGEIDAKAFIAASAELERLLGGEPNQPTSVLASGESRTKLRAMIENVLRAGEADDAARDAERSLRDEQAAIVAAGGSIEPAPSTPATVAPPPQPLGDNVVSLPDAAERANATKPPDHYLADYQRQHERWRGAAEFTVPSWPLPR